MGNYGRSTAHCLELGRRQHFDSEIDYAACDSVSGWGTPHVLFSAVSSNVQERSVLAGYLGWFDFSQTPDS